MVLAGIQSKMNPDTMFGSDIGNLSESPFN